MALWTNVDEEAGKPKFLSSAEKAVTFGVDKTEMIVGADNVVAASLVYGGNRYTEGSTVVTVSGGGGSNAAVSYSGSSAPPAPILQVFVTNPGSGYTSAPTITFGLPRKTIARVFVDPDLDTIRYPYHQLINGEAVKYYHAGGAPISALTNGATYYVGNATTGVFGIFKLYTVQADALAGTGASLVDLTDLGNNDQYFEIQDESSRATAVAILGTGGTGAAAHAGWVKRTVGYGGRAGRVQTEVLVAMGSMTTDNNDDDTAYPDA